MEKQWTTLHVIDDEQLIDDCHLLGTDGCFDAKTIKMLRDIKKQIPYQDHDFRLVEVLPFKNTEVDYSAVVFAAAELLEDESRRPVMYSEDTYTVFIERQHARTLAQVGVLFTIVPEVYEPIEVHESSQDNFEDAMESFWNPSNHRADLPVAMQENPLGLEENMNRIRSEKVVFERKRKESKFTQRLLW